MHMYIYSSNSSIRSSGIRSKVPEVSGPLRHRGGEEPSASSLIIIFINNNNIH